jgi:transposase
MEELERGQPLKLQKPGVREKFLAAIARGASYHIACGYAGFHYNTLRRWMIRGEALMELHEEQLDAHPDKIYYEFYCDVKRVESYAAIQWLEKIDKASEIHWQAAAWKLERRHPEDYGRRDKDDNKEEEDTSFNKARDEVSKLKGDNNG